MKNGLDRRRLVGSSQSDKWAGPLEPRDGGLPRKETNKETSPREKRDLIGFLSIGRPTRSCRTVAYVETPYQFTHGEAVEIKVITCKI